MRLAATAIAVAILGVASPASAWWQGGEPYHHGGHGFHGRGHSGFFFGFAPPLPYFPPAYIAPRYAEPQTYFAPPIYSGPIYSQPMGGQGCYAGPYACPLQFPTPVGGPCSCPANNGRVFGQAG